MNKFIVSGCLVFALSAFASPAAAEDGSSPTKETQATSPAAAATPVPPPTPQPAAPAPAQKDATKSQAKPDAAPAQKEQPKKDASKDAKDNKKSKENDKEQARQVQIGIRKLADKMAQSMQALPDGKYSQVAVLSFSETGKLAKDKELGKLVSLELMTYLHKEHGFYLVEREKLDKVIKELQVQQSGLVDDNTAAKIGKMVAARTLILGTVSEAGAAFIVNARVVDVETAKVMVAENVSFPSAGMVSLSSNAVELKSKWGAVFRSVIPGWGQVYNGQPIKGGIYAGLTVGFFVTAIAFQVAGQEQVDQYKKATDPLQAKNLRSNAEDKFLLRNISIYCGLGVWVINLVDAYVFGYDASKALASVPVLKDAKLALGYNGAMLSWGQEF